MSGMISRLKTASLGDTLVRRFPPLYSAFRQQLRTFDDSDIAGRQALQAQLIQETLAGAARLRGYAALKGAQLHDYPVLTKERLRSVPREYMSRSGLLSTAAATSGSSGVPLSLKRSFSSVVFEQAVLDHVAALAGADFRRDRVAVLRGGAVKDPSDRDPPYWRPESGGRVLNFSVAHLNAATAVAFIEALEAFSPKVMWVYPSALEMLVACFERDGRHMQVPVILSSSEVLSDELRAKAESLFGACVVDYYGQAERVSFAYALKAGAYRFLPAYGRVELHAVEGEDKSRFRMIATNLRNRAQPLIRYDTGDIAIVPGDASAASLNEVILGCRTFARIEGRESDYLLAPDGSRLIGMNHIPRSIDGLLQMQLRQTEPDRVLVLAVPDGQPSDVLKAAIAARMQARLPDTMRIEIRFCDAIEREKSGKMPLVVRAKDIGTSITDAADAGSLKFMGVL
ncbi:phenylacetate-CoA ligase [Rhizobium sp. NFR07]|uniref:AMP-binding protein n=1 Tax=Rhizobium sp. NFR07 TaxID=1566262 RepID=UPI0008EDC56E|nr:AMP-binding protein [Rhizobium sp. NFR07]SFA80437.1 phenylacetate-CoA ligase [Rhizobium sp. NFR07]